MMTRIFQNVCEMSIFKNNCVVTSLAVQWLKLCLLMQGVWVQYLFGELRSYMLHGQKKKIQKEKAEAILLQIQERFLKWFI